jgi:hypothetical protein
LLGFYHVCTGRVSLQIYSPEFSIFQRSLFPVK